ncbi:MAG: hypothetical protein NTU41_11685, partial [Chloroflexi bacterium]|nr:hypothetical protein [Chloroflexota bacterium]
MKPEDGQDFLHDLMVTMAGVKAKYNTIGKPLTEAGLILVACYRVADYWRSTFKRTNGHDCGQCNTEQRHRCHDRDTFQECPRAVKTDSLERRIDDGDGN